MTKLLLLTIFTILLAFTYAQPDARVDLNGVAYYSSVSGWTCAISFLYHGSVVRTESMSASNTVAILSDFDWIELDDDNVIDSISWSGSACNCWVELFDDDGFEGDTLGLWTNNSTTGSYDLTTYNYLEDSDAFSDDDYRQWNKAVSAYKIYCY